MAGLAEGGRLLSGYVDLVGVTAERLDVIDFKTDAPPRESAARSYPEYVAQVRAYGALLAASGAARRPSDSHRAPLQRRRQHPLGLTGITRRARR